MQLQHARGTLALDTPVVMGVLNVTPDSFSDGGRWLEPAAAIAHGLQMAAEGATFIDVGGESTRPGAALVDEDEELRRVLPVVAGLASHEGLLVSVDTSSPRVMREAVAAGAVLINDVRGLARPGALAAVAATGAAACLMHMQGTPATMQQAPRYGDVVAEVGQWLAARVEACTRAGIARARLCLDPGFGFGKTVEHNLELLRRLPELGQAGLPILAGLSRKSMLQALTGRGPADRIAGSVALATVAVLHGARIIRAHDVAATLDAIRVATAVAQRAPRHRSPGE
jgi:dihydropteroate synthase